MSPLVSILIPCYNAARWLSTTLDSALAQTHPRIEIIVVNDGSTDSSNEILLAYKSRGVRVVNQPNTGASSARNHALRLAHGDYIQYLDADDLLAPDKIANQLAHNEAQHPLNLLTASWARFHDTPTNAVFSPEPLCADFAPVDFLLTKFSTNSMMHPAAWLVPRTLTELVGPWDERLSLDDDGEYFTRAVLAAKSIYFCRNSRSYYRSGLPGSLSQQTSRRALESAYLSSRLATEHLLNHENSPRTRRATADALMTFVQGYYPSAPDLMQSALAEIKRLGGSPIRPGGGQALRMISRLLGWRSALRARNLVRRFKRPSRFNHA